MKKIFGIFILFFSLGILCQATYFKSKFMSVSEAEKKWGVQTLNIKQFKSGDLSKRAPMAVDIIKRSLYINKSRQSVRDDLGDPDSYFFSDTVYAYKIIPFPGKDKENWHLIFIPDEKLEKIKEVKIHKKCCYDSPL